MEDSQFILSKEVEVNFYHGPEHFLGEESTRVILVSEDQVKSALATAGQSGGDAEMIAQDLKRRPYHWIYNEGVKNLIVYSKDKKPQTLRDLGVKVVDECLQLNLSKVDFINEDILVEEFKHFVQSIVLWNYKYEVKTINQKKLLSVLNFRFKSPLSPSEISELEFYKTATKSTLLVRDLVNTRANVATPKYMEDVIKHVSSKSDKIKKVEVIVGKELSEQGLEVFYNVGKGAAIDPRLVHFVYKGNEESEEIEYAIVGKGITFDTGGLNLKKAPEDMYCDKTGACTTVGILKGVIELGLKINIVFAFAIAENSIDANSYRPSDIIKVILFFINNI